MPEKPQICIIHGGTVFDSRKDYLRSLAELQINYGRLLYAPSWKKWLAEKLTDRDVLLPSMPNSSSAEYDDWALYFSKILPFLRPDAVLVGHSLGGIFLAKYFSDNPTGASFSKLILVAAPYDDESGESLRDFKLEGASRLMDSFEEIHIVQSTDDPVVPAAEASKYQRDLPSAMMHHYDDKQHFNMAEFPELLEIIK